jgi:hypothetical protein
VKILCYFIVGGVAATVDTGFFFGSSPICVDE